MEREQPYTPTSFRSLAPVPDPEYMDERERKLNKIHRDLQRFDRIIPMFESGGWADLRQEFLAELQRAVNELADHKKTKTESDLAFIQGQMAMLQWFLGLGNTMQARRFIARKELQALEDSAE